MWQVVEEHQRLDKAGAMISTKWCGACEVAARRVMPACSTAGRSWRSMEFVRVAGIPFWRPQDESDSLDAQQGGSLLLELPNMLSPPSHQG